MKNKKFYLTTPIYYVNDRPHLGHAYTTIAADVLARYHRLGGEKVFFLTGTDEHGVKIEKAAQEAEKNPKDFCDENSKKFRESWQSLNISFDNFIRTTDSKHKKTVQKALQFLYENKFIFKGKYQGLYCIGCEQCKTQNDLVEGKCPDHQTEPILMTEENYIFKLSQFKNILTKKIETDQLNIRPVERKKEVLEFLKQGLQDISISRQKVKWGIPLPFDPSQTCYVWIDAFLNYLTGIGWLGDPKKIPEFWPADLHLMSKDIIRVHATIWPAILLALGIPLPKKMFVHGYFTINGQKMSKSLGNIIWPEELVKKFGADATRYLLLSVCPFGQDGDISWEKLIQKYNSDLAAGLGNLYARILTMLEKYCRGKIPKPKENPEKHPLRIDKKIQNSQRTSQEIEKHLAGYQFNEALFSIWKFIGQIDKYIEETKPWSLAKENKIEKLNWVLYGLADALSQIAWQIYVFMPQTALKIAKSLKSQNLLAKKPDFKKGFSPLLAGRKIEKQKNLFPKI